MRAAVLAMLMAMSACSGNSEKPDAGNGTPTSGGSCNRHSDCEDGFACRTHACIKSCTSNQPLVGGCVVGATCNDGHCSKNTSCDANTECAYDKGEVCDFTSGTCQHTDDTCSEGENETLCGNGYLCHINVCYHDCSGAKGCPSGQTCNNHACQ